jgi:predicted glycoside hydrolase/deacetylase ChbG (UPF0249 family)
MGASPHGGDRTVDPRDEAVSRRRFLQAGVLTLAGLVSCSGGGVIRPGRPLRRNEPSVAQRLGYPADTRLVIVNADDVGFCRSVNAAAIAAYAHRAITSASVMVPCPGFEELARWARGRTGLDLGIHLTFVSERPAVRWGPVLSPAKVPSLVDARGYFPREWTPEHRPRPSEVEAEIRAQIERARARGIVPTHLDAHQHILQFQGPEILETLARVAREQRLPFRVARAWFGAHPYLRRRSRFEDTVVLDHRIEIRPGLVPDAEWTRWYASQVRALPPGLTEILVHPGYDDDELRRLTAGNPLWGARWRQRDFDAVTSAAFAQALEAVGAVRTTWQRVGTLIER